MPASTDPKAGTVAFTHPDFTLFQIARFLIVAAVEMQAVAVGWQFYEITRRPLDLGMVGLAQFLPGILLFPISGHASDRFERKAVPQMTQVRRCVVWFSVGIAGTSAGPINASIA